MWLLWMQSSATPRSHVPVQQLIHTRSDKCLLILFYFFTPFRVLNDIHNPLVSRCVILITKLIFLIYVLGWQGGTILSDCHSFILFHDLIFFLGSPFPFLIFQSLRCSGSLKRPWGLQVLSFVSHFLLKQFFFNPMRLFTVVVLALSTLSRFLAAFFLTTAALLPPSAFSVSARGQCYTFFSCMQEGRGYLFSHCNLKIEKKNLFKVATKVPFLRYSGIPLSSNWRVFRVEIRIRLYQYMIWMRFDLEYRPIS